MTFHPEEFTTVNVNAQLDGFAVQLIALDNNARHAFTQVLDAAPDSLVWHSMGNHYHDNHTRDYVTEMFLGCGGTSYRRTEGNVTTFDYDGAIKICLNLKSAIDHDATVKLVQFAWFSNIRVDAESSTRDQLRLVAAVYCKACSGPLQTFAELEWKTCNDCAKVCKHSYVYGLGHYQGSLVNMPFCDKCGRGDPTWEPTGTPAEEAIKTVTEGSLDALMVRFSDGSSATITRK